MRQQEPVFGSQGDAIERERERNHGQGWQQARDQNRPIRAALDDMDDDPANA